MCAHSNHKEKVLPLYYLIIKRKIVYLKISGGNATGIGENNCKDQVSLLFQSALWHTSQLHLPDQTVHLHSYFTPATLVDYNAVKLIEKQKAYSLLCYALVIFIRYT